MLLRIYLYFFFFFFSSRRRHTRFDCDWSSDVCSSDLGAWELLAGRMGAPAFVLFMYVGRVILFQIGRLGTAWVEIQALLAGSSRVTELLEVQPDVPDGAEAIDD